MRSPQFLALRPAAGAFDSTSAGPAMTVLGTLIARIAVILRVVATAEMVVQVVIWHSFYAAGPWLLWAPVAALAWGGMAIAVLRHGRPGWRLVCADTAVYTGLALAAGWCVPVASRGEAGSWLFILVTSQIVTPVWFAPRSLSVPLAVTPGLAFAAGTALASPEHLSASPQKASVVLWFLVVAMHCLLRRMLTGRAATADAALAAAHREARDQYVVLAKNVERREQDRLLHDTILNTLTAIAGSGGTVAALSQCRQDIGLLETALGESGGAVAGPVAAIEAVVGEMRARGLAVDLAVTDAAAAAGATEPAPLPGPVVATVAHAAREALANVAAHAGTGKAWVTVSVTPPDEAAGPGRIQVTVRDTGAGFDPGRVDPARLGVRRSITERMADRRGSALVESAPGKGTTVRLCWPAPRPDVPPTVLRAAGAAAGEVPGQW